MGWGKKKNKSASRDLLDVNLTKFSGVVIQQRATPFETLAQSFGIPYEAKNSYSIMGLPEGAQVVNRKSSPQLWRPNQEDILALPELFVAIEESSCFNRTCFAGLGCRAMRPINLHIQEGKRERLKVNKPFNLGGCCCCPFEMTVTTKKGQVVGRVKQDFDPYCCKALDQACCFNHYHKVYCNEVSAPEAEDMDRGGNSEDDLSTYQLKVHTCCCSNNNNWCGGTCINRHAIYDIHNTQSDDVVANIQKMYAPSGKDCGLRSFGRMIGDFDTFALSFPENSSQVERVMLIVSVLQLDFQLFEKDQDADDVKDNKKYAKKVAKIGEKITSIF